MAKEHDSIATIWTNDKHSSYLNSIEAMFVGSFTCRGSMLWT
jgi:hypothetical protein